MKILILGFPRSGTTILYKIFVEALPNYYIKLYEPFNDFVNLTGGYAIHDYMPVENDYNRLDLETYRLLTSNIWFECFVEGKCNYGGKYISIFGRLDSFSNIIVKDIYIWPVVPEIRRLVLRDWKIVVIYRDPVKIYKDLLKWYYQNAPFLNVRSIYLGRNGVMFYHPDIIWGLNLYHRYLFKWSPIDYLPSKWMYGPAEIWELLVKTYDKFVEMISPIANYEITHDELIKAPEYEISKMFNELGIEVDKKVIKKVASLVKPV